MYQHFSRRREALQNSYRAINWRSESISTLCGFVRRDSAWIFIGHSVGIWEGGSQSSLLLVSRRVPQRRQRQVTLLDRATPQF